MANFRVRARALDMLGRQQIAGIPTAISELFKNAHDAYADKVEIDYLRHERLFVLRDDGNGMSRADFENRWLTLGTESKLSSEAGLAMPTRDESVPERPGDRGGGKARPVYQQESRPSALSQSVATRSFQSVFLGGRGG